MRCSQFSLSVVKEIPNNIEIVCDQWMIRAGLIHPLTLGVYTWLPLGLNVLRKIEQITRQQLDKIGALEIRMPPSASTHKAMMMDFARHQLTRYKQLPANYYQFHWQADDKQYESVIEAYSFHLTHASLQQTYEQINQAYQIIFEDLALTFNAITTHSSGMISNEFQLLITPSKASANLTIGQMVQLDKKYSESMKVMVINAVGKPQALFIGYYCLKLSHLVAAVIEQHHDDRGIIWPERLAPFQVALCPINMHKSLRLKAAIETLYQQLVAVGIEVLFDDRKVRTGFMFSEMDLIGIPHRLILTDRGLDRGIVEYQSRKEVTPQTIALDNIIAFLTKLNPTA
jgi:prolyl-tRNA synthetase